MKFVAILLALSMAPVEAIACMYYPPNPKGILSDNKNVVVAYPIGISNIPRAANNPAYKEDFRQTILWKVVVSWKGKYQPGDQFTTRRSLSRDGMCSTGIGIYTEKPLILAFNGTEPYSEYYDYSIEHDPEVFEYFQKKFVKAGT